MHGQRIVYTLTLFCACGHSVEYRSPMDVPAGLGADEFCNVKDEAWRRLRCKSCGRRGRPQSTIVGTRLELPK